MAWFRVHLTEEQQRIVHEERVAHHDYQSVRRCWSSGYCIAVRPRRSGQIVGVSRTTVHRYVVACGGWMASGRATTIVPRARWPPIATDPGVLRRATGRHDRPGLRPHLGADRTMARPQPGAEVPQGHGPEIPSRRVIPVPPKKSWPSMSRPKRLFSIPSAAVPGRRRGGDRAMDLR